MAGIQSNNFNTLINSPQRMVKKPEVGAKELEHKKPKKVDDIKLIKEHSNDPLSKYPIRGLAYSNEVGVAIADIAPKLGLALWIPALMYFGADIYNHYAKGRNGDYSQTSRRKGLERATFQALASVALPTAAVKFGQHLFSKIIKNNSKTGLSGTSQVEILQAISTKIGEGKFAREIKSGEKVPLSQDRLKKLITDPILEIVNHRREQGKRIKHFSGVHFKETPKMGEKEVQSFIDNTLKEVLDLKNKLENKQEFDALPKSLKKKYNKVLKNNFIDDTKVLLAKRETMQKFLEQKMAKPKNFKTIGGFIALIALALPIDYLVEEVILKKYVQPGLDHMEKNIEKGTGFLGFLGHKK